MGCHPLLDVLKNAKESRASVLRRGQRIEGFFVLFVKDFIFGFTCYPISGMVSGEVEIYVEENEISKRSEDPCVFYRRKGSEEKVRFYPMKSRIRVA